LTWKPGDAPQGHPLWEAQLALELQMIQRGSDKYRDLLSKAYDKEDLSRMRPYRKAAEVLVIDTMIGLRSWLGAVARKRTGGLPIAYDKLRSINPGSAAFIVVKCSLDTYGARGGIAALAPLAHTVGHELELQARMEAWLSTKEGKALYAEIQKGLRKNRATEAHRKRVNINRFNALVADDLHWHKWTRDEKHHAGMRLIDIMVQSTRRFEIMEDPEFVRTGRVRARYILKADDELEQYLSETLERDAAAHPVYLPTLVPPKPWVGVRDGGYYTKLVRKPPLVKFSAHSEEGQGIAMDEFDALDMPRVYAAVEAVQNVPWRVNKRVLGVAWDAWDRELTIRGLARQSPAPLPPRPAGLEAMRARMKGKKGLKEAERRWIAENPDEFKAWKRSAAKVYGENARRVSHAMSARTTLFLAQEFQDKEFYFPHALDFRGRMYPIPSYLTPQGNDLARGLLTFAHGRPLGETGGWWLAVNVANNWGKDKLNYDERVAWVMEQLPLMERIAAAPLKNLEWTQSKSPWQLLAAIMEMVRATQEGDAMVSALPVRVDGTCNGIQHLSAMMRDPVGAAAVNMMAPDHDAGPRDIYGETGAVLQETLEGIEASGGKAGHLASVWLDGLDREIDRSFTKRQVMVLPYGGTREAYFRYTHKWLEEKAEEENGVDRIPADLKREAVPWMVNHMWNAVKSKVVSGMAAMEWLKSCAKVLVETNQPIIWTTPSGFVVRHFYGKLKERRVEMLVSGRSMKIVDYERTKDLSPREQLQGISPNFVHSMDASANMETAINFAVASGGAPYTTIHDSFGTCAGTMGLLHDTLRYAFVWVHSRDVLEEFRQRCVLTLRDHIVATHANETLEHAWERAEDMVPRVPERGDYDVREVLNADYFFA
jgi:DNA-directed RNA polymerase